MPDKRPGPRAKRIAERELRGALEQSFEQKLMAPARQKGVIAGRTALAGFRRQSGR